MNRIRLLSRSDMAAAVELSDAAGWNQTPADWARLIELEPGGCFALEVEGELAATATAVRFGSRLAWIGMVLTHPAHRRKGYARALMEHVLRRLAEDGVEWIKLDATDMGRPLYAALGFQAEGLVERWETWAPVLPYAPAVDGYLPNPDLDLAAFGAPRDRVLDHLARGEAASAGDAGFAMGRPGRAAASFGPCVVRTPEAARNLLQWFLTRHQGENVFWDLLPENQAAVRLAREHGFELRRRLVRMVCRGQPASNPLRFDNSLVYATAGFEYG